MARIRTIKPEFWTDSKIIECSTNARLLFIGLWNFADDQGNLDGSRKSIKALIFPADDIKIEPLLTQLHDQQLIQFYGVLDRQYLHISGFKEHQKIDRPGKPRCPDYEHSLACRREIVEPSSPEGKGKEGIGKEKHLKVTGPASAPPAPNSEENFNKLWEKYPRKLKRKKALARFQKQITTPEDWVNIQKALQNYIADVEHQRRNGHPDLAWQHGSTWFNENWRDYVQLEDPAEATGDDWDKIREANLKKSKGAQNGIGND